MVLVATPGFSTAERIFSKYLPCLAMRDDSFTALPYTVCFSPHLVLFDS